MTTRPSWRQFEALGIEKSLAKKAAEESKKELEGYVAKDTYDQTEQQRKQLETSVNDYKTQLETLKTTAGDNAALTQQITDFQNQIKQKDLDHQKEITDLKLTNAIKLAISASAQAGDNAALTQQITDFQNQIKQKDLDHQKEITDLKLTNAIKLAISASAQDSDLVAGLVDRNKLILGEDGKVTGLDEQVKSLKESKPFLFKAEQKPAAKKGFFPIGAKETDGGSGGEGGRMTMKEAIALKESKPFLFKAEQKPAAKKGFFPIGAKETDGGSGGEGGRMTMKEAIAAKLGMGADEKGE